MGLFRDAIVPFCGKYSHFLIQEVHFYGEEGNSADEH
mgnify:CR=1 FL=1